VNARRLTTGAPLPPFGDPLGQSPVLARPLATVQETALAEAGVTLLPDDAPPPAEPHLVFSDRTWFTAELARRVAAAGPGRLRVTDPVWWEITGALQDTPAPGVYEIGVHPGGQGGLDTLEPVDVDLELRPIEPPTLHPAMQHAMRPLLGGAAMVHQIDHWSHLLRVNHLAIGVLAEEARLFWERAPWWRKVWMAIRVLAAARSINPSIVARALTEKGKNVRIHPTASVEACRIGDDVEIGAYSVVRASVLADGAKVEEHATIGLSVIGAGARVGRYAMANLCVLDAGCQVSTGGGYQASIFGRDSFMAWGATGLDLSFGGHIKVMHRGERVDSGQHFLGVAIGHRARIGNGVRLNHGVAVPSDAFVVAPGEDLLRKEEGWPEGAEIVGVERGRAVKIR